MIVTTYNDMASYSDIEQEISEWSIKPVSKAQIEPMEAINRTAGYAVEQHQWTNYHHLAEMTQNKEVQQLFVQISFEEEEHQSLMGSLEDPQTTPLEASLTTEMAALQGFTDAAQLEKNEVCKNTYNYTLLDHLTQTYALSEMASSMGTVTSALMKGHIQVQEGRPFERQFVPTPDLFKQPLDKNSDDIMSFVNLHTLLATEESLRNEFHMFRKILPSQDMRKLYNTITAIENIHVSMLGSLHDPTITPLEYAMVNELMEIRIHQMGMQMAKNDSAKQAHEYAMKEDEQHLTWLRDAYSNIEGGDVTKFAPSANMLFMMPKMSANDYIQQIMQTEIGMMARGMGFEKAA